MFILRHYCLIFNFTAHYKNFIPYNNIYRTGKKKNLVLVFARLSFPLSWLCSYFLMKTILSSLLSCFSLFFPISLIGKIYFSIIFTAFFSPILSSFLCSGPYSSSFITMFDLLFPGGGGNFSGYVTPCTCEESIPEDSSFHSSREDGKLLIQKPFVLIDFNWILSLIPK